MDDVDSVDEVDFGDEPSSLALLRVLCGVRTVEITSEISPACSLYN